jgi:glycogen synthase
MASGLPVIVTDTGGTAELVTGGENGEIVSWADVPALTAALRTLLKAGDLRLRMGKESRRRALEFGWPALATRYLELCERVMVTGEMSTSTNRFVGRSVMVLPNNAALKSEAIKSQKNMLKK